MKKEKKEKQKWWEKDTRSSLRIIGLFHSAFLGRLELKRCKLRDTFIAPYTLVRLRARERIRTKTDKYNEEN